MTDLTYIRNAARALADHIDEFGNSFAFGEDFDALDRAVAAIDIYPRTMTDSLDEMLAGMVLPLEFIGGVAGYLAGTEFGQYAIEYYEDADLLRWTVFFGGIEVVGRYPTDLIALSAAQQDYARRIISALNPDILRGMREAKETFDGLQKFGESRSHSLEYHGKVYGDDDDEPTHNKWVIYRETGNINDREWDVVATGDTPSEALRSLSPKDLSNGK